MANRDEILRELLVEIITSDDRIKDILVGNVFKYNGPFNFTDPRHIPDKGYVDAQLGGVSTPLIEITGSGAGGIYDLSSYLSGTQTIARVTVNGIGVGFDNNGGSIYDYYVTAGSTDIVRFYVLGQPLPAPPLPPAIPEIGQLIILNNSSQPINVNDNGGGLLPLASGANINHNFAGFDSLYLEWPVGTTYIQKLYDSTGTQVGSTVSLPNPPSTTLNFVFLDATKGYLLEIIDTSGTAPAPPTSGMVFGNTFTFTGGNT